LIAYINGCFSEEPKISSFDHSFLYGDGCFETLRAYNGKIFEVEEHIKRLKNACSILKINLPSIDYEEIFYELLSLNSHQDAMLRMTVSRGEGPRGIDPELCQKPNVVVISEEFFSYPDEWYEDGIDTVILDIKKTPKDVLPSIKSNNYLNNILAKIEAKEKGVGEGIFLTIDGHVAGGITSNIFIVNDGKLITPPLTLPILPGITRKVVIEIARSLDICVLEEAFYKEELFNADEVFLTNTGYEIMPIRKINDRIIGVGKITKNLLAHFRDITNG